MSGSIVEISQLATPANANLTDIIPATQGSIGPGTGQSVGITVQQIVQGGFPVTVGALTASSLVVSGTSTLAGNVTTGGSLVVASGLQVTTGGLVVSAGGANITGNLSASGALASGGALTVSSGGYNVTGNSTVTGTLTTSSSLVVSGGGLTVTGASTFNNGMTIASGLTISSGGYNVTGNSIITGTLGVSGALTPASVTTAGAVTAGGGLVAPSGGLSVVGNSGISGQLTVTAGINVTSAGASIVGTGNVTGTWDVSGTGSFGGLLALNAGTSAPFGGGWSYTAAGDAMQAPGTFNVSCIAQGIIFAGAFLASSDERLKSNIAPITPERGLAWVLSSKPKEYWKSGMLEWGFLAQDQLRSEQGRKLVGYYDRAGLPETNEDDLYIPVDTALALDRTNGVAALVAAIQALHARIEDIENERH